MPRTARIALLAACIAVAASFALAQPAAETRINLRVQYDMGSIDPASIGNNTEHALGFLIYNGLVQYAVGSLEVIPDLATHWDISDDGLTYTFYLREGVQWHKGYGELTAEDVVYSFERIRDPATASRFQNDVAIIDTIEAVDRYTVRFTLREPFSPFISAVLAFRPGWIVNQRAVEDRGETYGVDPIGTGPYMFESWSRGTEIILRRNPDYFEPVEIDIAAFRIIFDDTVVELALRTGELDVAYVFDQGPALRLIELAKGESAELNIRQAPGYRTHWATFNLERPVLQDIRVRQAIIHAVDKPAATEAVYGPLGRAVSSIFNPNIPGYIDPNPFPYDPDRARQLLAEAGFADGISIKVLVIPSSGWPELSTVLQDMWRRVGIEAELILRERAVYDELVRGDDYDILAQNISRADAFQYASFLYGPNAPFPNAHRYSGADDLIEAARAEPNDEARLALWRAFQERVLVEDVAGFGMANASYLLVWRDGIEGVDSMYQDSYAVHRMSLEE